jgi:hypothetical protein
MEFRDAHVSIFTDGNVDSLLRGKGGNIDVFGKEKTAWQVLRMMVSMDTLIISNSSLSWWAATLGADINATQRVIAPNRWFKNLPASNKLILGSWEKRECMWLK